MASNIRLLPWNNLDESSLIFGNTHYFISLQLDKLHLRDTIIIFILQTGWSSSPGKSTSSASFGSQGVLTASTLPGRWRRRILCLSLGGPSFTSLNPAEQSDTNILVSPAYIYLTWGRRKLTSKADKLKQGANALKHLVIALKTSPTTAQTWSALHSVDPALSTVWQPIMLSELRFAARFRLECMNFVPLIFSYGCSEGPEFQCLQLILSSFSTNPASPQVLGYNSVTPFRSSSSPSSPLLNSGPLTCCLATYDLPRSCGMKANLLLFSRLPSQRSLDPKYRDQTSSRLLERSIWLIGWWFGSLFVFCCAPRCWWHVGPDWKLCFLLWFRISHSN